METKGGELSSDDCSGSAVQAARDGSYSIAATLAIMAYNITSDPSEKARMARAGNAYRHLGNYEEAEKWLTEAVNQHETLAEQEPNRSTLRELGASAAMLATMQLSRIASNETFDTPENNTKTVETFRYGLEKLEDSHEHADRLNREIDQYDINFTARASYAETLAGNKKRGLALGVRAVRLAFWSESPQLDTTNTSLSKKERYKTKARALVRGIGALAVGIVAPVNRRAAKILVRKLS